jgi:hypothetical protein
LIERRDFSMLKFLSINTLHYIENVFPWCGFVGEERGRGISASFYLV